MIHLLENIDGQNDFNKLVSIMLDEWEVPYENTTQILELLQQNRIITEVVEDQASLSAEL